MTNIAKEFGLSRQEVKRITHKINDLTVQSMLFDMDIDIETLGLTEKIKSDKPKWLNKWDEKRRSSDNDAGSPEQAWA